MGDDAHVMMANCGLLVERRALDQRFNSQMRANFQRLWPIFEKQFQTAYMKLVFTGEARMRRCWTLQCITVWQQLIKEGQVQMTSGVKRC